MNNADVGTGQRGDGGKMMSEKDPLLLAHSRIGNIALKGTEFFSAREVGGIGGMRKVG